MDHSSKKEEKRFINLCPVFISENIKKTVAFYTEKLGFQAAKHYDKSENFVTLYRDEIEFVIVQARQGAVLSNQVRHGAGYDAYIDPATLEGVDLIYEEYKAKGVKIIQAPHKTDYGSYEMVIEDIDGRQIGIGLIADRDTYFKNSDFTSKEDR